MTFCESFVSKYNQINARKEVKGIETIIAAKREDLLAISDTITTVATVMSVFNKRYIISHIFH